MLNSNKDKRSVPLTYYDSESPNVWLDIDLNDYEGHMSMPSIAQAQYLASFLKKVIKDYSPESIAILGCSGGNGLDDINPNEVKKIICVDINPSFIETARKRYSDIFPSIDFICNDISSDKFEMKKTELIVAGLIFEYVDIEKAVKNTSGCIKKNGRLAVVLQMPNENIPEVTPSEYKSLNKLSKIFSFVQIDKFIDNCRGNGFQLKEQNITKLKSGKEFAELILQKENDT